MFAHDRLELPANLLPDDVADLLALLGHRVDRRNVTRALEAAQIPGVVAPASRATRWTIPREALLDVVAAVLHRRWLRTAAPGRWSIGSLAQHRLPAARLLMKHRHLAPLVPDALRRRVRAEWRAAEAAAEEQRRQQRAEAERVRRQAEWQHRQEEKSLERFALLQAYCDVRMVAQAARFPAPSKELYGSPEFHAFLEQWPYPSPINGRPAWWLPPPGMLEAVRERTDPWLAGTTKGLPDTRDLVPADIDFTKPWPWRVESADDAA